MTKYLYKFQGKIARKEPHSLISVVYFIIAETVEQAIERSKLRAEGQGVLLMMDDFQIIARTLAGDPTLGYEFPELVLEE